MYSQNGVNVNSEIVEAEFNVVIALPSKLGSYKITLAR